MCPHRIFVKRKLTFIDEQQGAGQRYGLDAIHSPLRTISQRR